MKRAVDLSHPRTRTGAPAWWGLIGHAAAEGMSLPGADPLTLAAAQMHCTFKSPFSVTLE